MAKIIDKDASKEEFLSREKIAWKFSRQDWLVLISPKFVWWFIITLPSNIKDIWRLIHQEKSG